MMSIPKGSCLGHWAVVVALPMVLVIASCSREEGPVRPVTTTHHRPIDPSETVAVSGEWPQFHGPNLDNISSETGLLKTWPSGGPERIWTVEGVGTGFSSAAIADGLIYTAGNRGGDTTITALDLNGQLQWQKPNGPAYTSSHRGTRGTPTVNGNRLYHESPLGNVICMDAKSGQKIWSRNILEEFGSENIRWALAESVVIDGDRVICTPGGPQTCIVALDKSTGETVWQSPSAEGDLAGYASPSVAELHGVPMILQMTGEALVGVNADDGDLLFRLEHITRYDVNATRPIFKDGHVFISSNYGTGSVMVKLNVDGDRVMAEKVWQYKPLDNHHGGVILLDGYLYGSSGRAWHCVQWETGEGMYQEKGVGKGSLTYADGMLYTLSENGTMGLVAATPDGHELVGQFDLPKGGKGNSWAHPVVCGGRLYIRHGDFLYAYDVRVQ
jgi:outer membrane protein assembly factor BamB